MMCIHLDIVLYIQRMDEKTEMLIKACLFHIHNGSSVVGSVYIFEQFPKTRKSNSVLCLFFSHAQTFLHTTHSFIQCMAKYLDYILTQNVIFV